MSIIFYIVISICTYFLAMELYMLIAPWDKNETWEKVICFGFPGWMCLEPKDKGLPILSGFMVNILLKYSKAVFIYHGSYTRGIIMYIKNIISNDV